MLTAEMTRANDGSLVHHPLSNFKPLPKMLTRISTLRPKSKSAERPCAGGRPTHLLIAGREIGTSVVFQESGRVHPGPARLAPVRSSSVREGDPAWTARVLFPTRLFYTTPRPGGRAVPPRAAPPLPGLAVPPFSGLRPEQGGLSVNVPGPFPPAGHVARRPHLRSRCLFVLIAAIRRACRQGQIR